MKGGRTWCRTGALVAIALASASPTARADDRADDLKRRGDEAMEAGRAAEALDAYHRAVQIAPSPALDYNVGRARLALGDFAGALAAFERYEATAPDELRRRTHGLPTVLSELRAKVATLVLRGDLEGARIRIRGAIVVGDPRASMRLNAGPADVRVDKEGAEPFVVNLDLAPGRSHELFVALRPERVVAKLAIFAQPSGARIVVDGESRGRAPLELELEPGAHYVLAEAHGYERRRVDVTLARDQSARVDVALVPAAQPLTSRWWFWTGLAVVLVGAGAAAVAATTERAPSSGTLGTFHVP